MPPVAAPRPELLTVVWNEVPSLATQVTGIVPSYPTTLTPSTVTDWPTVNEWVAPAGRVNVAVVADSVAVARLTVAFSSLLTVELASVRSLPKKSW